MPTQTIIDTTHQTMGKRLPVHKEGNTTHYEYTNGVEVTVEKTEEGNPAKGLKEVRTVTRTKTRRSYFSGFGPGKLKKPYREGSEQDAQEKGRSGPVPTEAST